MSNLERRSDTRHPVEIPLWFHILLQPNPARRFAPKLLMFLAPEF